MALNKVVDVTSELEGFCLEDGEEEDMIVSKCSEADTKFDTVIGHIEDIIMGDRFQTLQTKFLEAHYKEFEDTEENKFSYSDIHQSYTQLIEKFLETELSSCIPDFSMKDFLSDLVSRKEELEGEVFEILLMFSDFLAFKEMILDYKANKDGRCSIDLTSGITVTSLSAADMLLTPTPRGAGDGELCQQLAVEHVTIPPSEPTAATASTATFTPSLDFDFCVVGKAVKPKGDDTK